MAQGNIGDLVGGSVYRVTVTMTGQLQQVQTGFYVRDTGLADQSAGDCLTAAKDWVDNHFRTCIPQDYTLQRLEAMEITTKEYAQAEYVSTPGTFGSTSTASFLAALVSLRSSQRARHRNGRMFWPVAAVTTNSQLFPQTLAAFTPTTAAFADRFMGNAATKPFKAVIVAAARPATSTRPAIAHSWIDVETIKVSTAVTSLRRRKVGVGS